jgi:U6 snRNA-associated Sm-like protein LSm1
MITTRGNNSTEEKMASANSAFLPGAASLVDHLDQTVSVLLQDGRNFIGILRSYDQYLNLVLHKATERLVFKGSAALRII